MSPAGLGDIRGKALGQRVNEEPRMRKQQHPCCDAGLATHVTPARDNRLAGPGCFAPLLLPGTYGEFRLSEQGFL